MAYATVSNRRLRAEGSNSDVPESKVHRGSGSSDELVEEMVIDSAAPSWGQNIQKMNQNIQKMMICMMGKIDGTADDILEVKALANNAKSEAAEASTAVNLLRVEVDTIKKSINELQGRRPSVGEQNYEKSRTITFGKFPEDTKSERIIETIETVLKDFMHDIEDNGIFAYGKKFATMGAARFKTEEAMWTYLKNDSKSKCMNIDDYVLYVNRAEQGTSDDQARTKAVRKLVRAIIEEEGGGAHTKTKIDTNYRRGTVWYHDVRMGDFRDGQMMLTNNGAKFSEKFKQLME